MSYVSCVKLFIPPSTKKIIKHVSKRNLIESPISSITHHQAILIPNTSLVTHAPCAFQTFALLPIMMIACDNITLRANVTTTVIDVNDWMFDRVIVLTATTSGGFPWKSYSKFRITLAWCFCLFICDLCNIRSRIRVLVRINTCPRYLKLKKIQDEEEFKNFLHFVY